MSGSAATEGEGPRARASAEPQSLRTLRFGDRTISYDHEGDGGGDDDGVGGQTSLGIEGGEGETQGRHTWNFVSQFKLMQLFSSSLTYILARLPHCCFNLSRHILADANKAVD